MRCARSPLAASLVSRALAAPAVPAAVTRARRAPVVEP